MCIFKYGGKEELLSRILLQVIFHSKITLAEKEMVVENFARFSQRLSTSEKMMLMPENDTVMAS